MRALDDDFALPRHRLRAEPAERVAVGLLPQRDTEGAQAFGQRQFGGAVRPAGDLPAQVEPGGFLQKGRELVFVEAMPGERRCGSPLP